MYLVFYVTHASFPPIVSPFPRLWFQQKQHAESSGIRESSSTCPPCPDSTWQRITPGRCFTVLDFSLSPVIVNLSISCTKPSSNLDPHLSQDEDPSWEFQSNSIRDWLSHHIWLTYMRHRLLLGRGWGKLGGSRVLLGSRVSRRSWFITSGKLSASLRNSHTAVILIKASKVKEMYTGEISKGNASYLSWTRSARVSRDASKRHVIPPQLPCGRCGHVDSVEGWTLEIRNVLAAWVDRQNLVKEFTNYQQVCWRHPQQGSGLSIFFYVCSPRLQFSSKYVLQLLWHT